MTASWFVRVCAWMLLMTTGVYAVRPMISYRAIELDATTAQIGYIAAAFGIVSLFLAIPAGRWIDRVGETHFVVAGAAMMALVGFWLIGAGSVIALFFAQATLGAGQVLGVIAMQSLVATGGAPEDRDARFGMFGVAVSVGQIIGPSMGGALATMAGGSLQRVFLVSGLVMLGMVVIGVSLYRWPAPDRRDETGASPKADAVFRAVGQVLRIRSMPQAMISGLTVIAVIDLLGAYLPVYGEAHGISVATVGLLLSVRAATSVLSRLVMVLLIRRFGRKYVFVGSLLLPAAALLALPVFPHVPTLFVLMALAGFGLGLGQPMSVSWVSGAAPANVRGTALGVRMTGNRAGQAALPLMVGGVGGVAGVSAIFVVLGLMLAGSAAFVLTADFEDAPAHPTQSSS